MKKYPFLLFLLLTVFTKAQDSLSITNSNLNFNVQDQFFYNDTLDFNYSLMTTGVDATDEVLTRASVRNSVNHNGVDSTVIHNLTPSFVDYSLNNTVSNRLILRSAIFSNGNNTVVIWPDHNSKDKFAKDSLKFTVAISGYLAAEEVPLFEKMGVSSASGEISFTNQMHSSLNVNLFNVSGQFVSKFKLNALDKQTVNVKQGVYFITLFDQGVYYRHKILVH